MLYYIILYYTILYYTILYYTILYYTILYYTILYYTILYYTILYYMLCYIILVVFGGPTMGPPTRIPFWGLREPRARLHEATPGRGRARGGALRQALGGLGAEPVSRRGQRQPWHQVTASPVLQGLWGKVFTDPCSLLPPVLGLCGAF